MVVSLKQFKQELRPYQELAIEKAVGAREGSTILLAFPTGTGKGTTQLALIKKLRSEGKRAWIVTPSIEVVRGYLERCGATVEDLSAGEGHLIALARQIFVTTPVRLRNWLKRGRRVSGNGRRKLIAPDMLILDEAHHAKMDNIAGGGLRKFCPQATFVGFTATPFRSSPDETAELQKFWGDPHHILTIPDAITNGAWALPKWEVEPIINDDDLDIVKGDLDADEASFLAARPMIAMIMKKVSEQANKDGTDWLQRPTCITLPNVKTAREVTNLLDENGITGCLVTADTPAKVRARMYKRVKTQGKGKHIAHCRDKSECITSVKATCECKCEKCTTKLKDLRPSLLVSVRVLGEGVDLPWLRRWIDASPTLSPVSWLQKLGRITRPHESGPPEYVGTNRNLERHGYLLQGAIPRAEFKIVQEKFGGGSRRPRTTTLKGVSKLKPIKVTLSGGIEGLMFAVWCPNKLGGSGFERCIIQDPTSDRVLCMTRQIDSSKEGAERLSDWVLEKKTPKKVVGFRARNLRGMPTAKQMKFWSAQAENRGLSATGQPTERGHPTREHIFALGALTDTKSSMREGGKTLRPERVKKPEAAEANGEATEEKTKPVKPLSPVLDGYYTVVHGYGENRTWSTYRLATQHESDTFMPGVQIMGRLVGPDNYLDYKNCANYVGTDQPKKPNEEMISHWNGIHVWSAFSEDTTRIEDDWTTIMRGPDTAGHAYALQSGRCWKCNKKLTVPDSIHNGLGPDCFEKVGAIRAELEAERLDREGADYEKDSVIAERKKPHEETKGLSNIALMKKLILEEKEATEIKRLYFERYALEEKLSGKEHKKNDTWKMNRIRTYHKIAMEKLGAEGKLPQNYRMYL